MLILSLAVLATSATLTVGPLLPRGEGAPASVCTAFVAQHESTTRLVTARHCLAQSFQRVWLPDLKGDALDTRSSRWSTLHPVAKGEWNDWRPGADVAWAPAPVSSSAPTIGPAPSVGDDVVVRGYPQGVGPVEMKCKVAGVVVLAAHPPRVRPSLRCASPLPPQMKGVSGGPVFDVRGRVVGVLVSGTPAPEGGTLPGFEPLVDSWLPDGVSEHWLITDPGPARHRLRVEAEDGQVISYTVRSPTGVAWSWWPTDTLPDFVASPSSP